MVSACWLNVVLAFQHVEIGAADCDVFVQCGRRNGSSAGADGGCEIALRLPAGDGFEEEHAAFEHRAADAADSFVRQRGFDGTWEADAVRPGVLQLRRPDCGHELKEAAHARRTRADKVFVNNRPASDHITEDQRENYLLNRLVTSEKNQLREHCALCSECLSALDRDDLFISALRIATEHHR